MANNYFQFKEFKIMQEKAAMKVGTDGVLLGAWADCANTKNILDIGVGTGLISLMLAQRSDAIITGIDIDTNAIEDAKNNVKNSKWQNRIIINQTSLQEFAKTTHQTFDLIVSNPPFFENSLKANSESRTLARHTDNLSIDDLLKSSAILLSKNGICVFIIPVESYATYTKIAKENNLFLRKILWVKPTPEKDPKRILIEFTKRYNKPLENSLIIEEFGRHQYSQDYIELTKCFYLKM